MNSNKNLLCMKWDEFDHFVVNGVFDLYQKDEMADVTLFCEGRSFKAHRVLLCMWSSYFKEVFSATSHPHPVIILRETASVDLELILRFMYQGQLFVPYEDADRFLKTAEYFQIAGLRNMRIRATVDQSNHPSTFPSNSNFAANNNTAKSQNLHENTVQSMQSFGPNGTPYTVNSNNIPNTSVRIINNSSSSSLDSHQHSNTSPISIISDNASQTHFSSNVIRSNGRSNMLQQRSQLPIRSLSPVQSTSTHSYTHGGGKAVDEIVYETQPVLIVHNQQKVNEYHSQRNRGPSEHRRGSESVVILENTDPNGQTQLTSNHQDTMLALPQNVSGGGTYTMYSQSHPVAVDTSGQEEVLGLEYLHDNSRSSHSQIIQEAAAAAGVEDTEIMDNREMPFSSSVPTTCSSRVMKPNSVVLTSTTTPVYAVKRVPQTSTVQPSSSNETIKTIAKTAKTKPKRRKLPTDQQGTGNLNSGDNDKVSRKIEFVNCPKCSKRVKKTSLKVHMKRTHLEEGTVLSCPICGKQISSKGVYYKHMYLHRQKSESHNVKIDT